MIKIYQVSTNNLVAEAQNMEMATELINTLGAYYGLLEVR